MKDYLLSRFKSLRFRIFLSVLSIGLLPGVIIVSLFMRFYERRALAADTASITNQAQLLSTQIVTGGYLNDPSISSVNTQMTALGNIYSGRVMVINPSMLVVKDTYNMYDGRTIVWENVIQSALGSTTSWYDTRNHCLTVTVPMVNASGSESRIEGVLLITRSTDNLEQNILYFESLSIIFMIILVVVSVILAVLLSGRYVAPIRKITAGIAEIERGQGDGCLHVNDFNETVGLSVHFNGYAESLRKIDESRQEFVSNVSHELKTPLTSMKVLADSISGMEDVPVDIYREFMADITTEIDRETDIINDLLALVRMDKTGASLNIGIVNINELIELILKRLRPIAEKQEIDLVMESFRPVTAEIDEVKLSLAITNLIENGIKYNNPGGYVHVSLNADHRYFYIRVEDNGLGIPDESLDSIFERFYRVDKSHSREIGGNGLGLAITRDAIVMHRGEIKVSSTLGEGTTFDVRIPLKYITE